MRSTFPSTILRDVWYHPHRHGSTALQAASGASGALIDRGDRKYVGHAPVTPIPSSVMRQGSRCQSRSFYSSKFPTMFDEAGKIIVNPDQTWNCPAGETGVVEDFQD